MEKLYSHNIFLDGITLNQGNLPLESFHQKRKAFLIPPIPLHLSEEYDKRVGNLDVNRASFSIDGS